MKTYTVDQIKDWLSGFFYVDGNGKVLNHGLALKSIIQLIEDDQDGIEAVFERKEYYENKINKYLQ